MSKTRIFVVDDHPITRQGVEQLLNSQADMAVCGHAEDAVQALQGIQDAAPDLIVTDLSLTGMDGLDLTKQVRAKFPDLPVLILSMHDESLYAQRAIRSGARGYIMKSEAPEKFLFAVRQVLQGKIYLSEHESSRALAGLAGSGTLSKSPIEQLSDRELEVFRWLGQGCTIREIAERLHLSAKTVETHCSHIKTKLNISNSRELARQAIHWVQQEQA